MQRSRQRHAAPRKKRKVPPKGEPPLSTVGIGPLSKIISSKEGRRLHRSVITLRNKVVAHAESRYFPVRIVAAVLPPSSGRMGDFAIKSGQTYPRLDLRLLRSNAKQLAAVFGLYGHLQLSRCGAPGSGCAGSDRDGTLHTVSRT